jgi:hypothetical protein
LNSRPLVPETSALARLRYAPNQSHSIACPTPGINREFWLCQSTLHPRPAPVSGTQCLTLYRRGHLRRTVRSHPTTQFRPHLAGPRPLLAGNLARFQSQLAAPSQAWPGLANLRPTETGHFSLTAAAAQTPVASARDAARQNADSETHTPRPGNPPSVKPASLSRKPRCDAELASSTSHPRRDGPACAH